MIDYAKLQYLELKLVRLEKEYKEMEPLVSGLWALPRGSIDRIMAKVTKLSFDIEETRGLLNETED